MKRNLLLMSLILTSFIGQAQFDVINNRSNTIVSDGETLTFTEASCQYSEPCAWKFGVENTSSQDIYVKIFVDGLTNTDGSNFQICFAEVCLNSIALNGAYPSTAALIVPGATNSAGNSFWNLNPASTSTPMDWTMRFQAFDAADNEIGIPVSVTYSYNPSLSIEDSELSSIKVFPTHVKTALNISSNNELKAEFYNILGQRVKQTTLASGDSTIDVSDLLPGLYIIRFTTKTGETLVKKIVIE
jgi:hypothetical protein